VFDKSSRYYDDYYSFLDYEAAATKLRTLIAKNAPQARTLLDVACGTGRYLGYIQNDFIVEGLDINPALLQIASENYPNIPFHQNDMINFDLGCEYDVITCLFCSIGYMTELENAQRAIARMAAHVKPGGILIVEPWITPEQCWTDRVSSEVLDRPELKIVRMHTHEKEGRTSIFNIHNLIGTPQGVEHFVEREVLGLYTHEEYLTAFAMAGLEATYLQTELFPGHAYGLLIGKKTVAN
jgi:SAM-dependent methyltransferase